MPPIPRLLAYIGIGLVAGFLSGLFGVGGGVLIVPALVLLLQFDQKVASGTSLLAVVPIAIVGMLAYLTAGQVDWAIGIPLAIGMITGGILGSWLLHRLPTMVISWIFIAVLLVVAVRLFFEEPVRGVSHPVDALGVVLLVAFGVLVGTLSGLVGVGGGVIIVPSLIVFWGIGDLVAKGASLVAMIPSAITTSVQNLLRRNGDLIAGLSIGIPGALMTFPGSWLATAIDPKSASILFGVFLLAVVVQLSVRNVRKMRKGRSGA